MSGETEKDISSWTVDSLNSHIKQLSAELAARFEQRVDQSDKRIDQRMASMDKMVCQKLSETDKRYTERFEASSKAVEAALTASTKAVESALAADKRAVDAAMAAAAAAVNKAEISADKRFAAVNEFRGQLADQAATFVTRNEFKQVSDLIPTMLTRREYEQAHENLKEQVSYLRSLADASGGADRRQRTQVANIVAAVAVVGLIITVVAMLLGVR